jgi:hypothetical protein
VLRQTVQGATPQINVRPLTPGLYQLRLRQADGAYTGWTRFVKQ